VRAKRKSSAGKAYVRARSRARPLLRPTKILSKDATDPIVQDEIFGPVLTVQIADDFEHAVALGNGTEFGLVAGVYTRDVSRAFRFAQAIDARHVFINQYFAGGFKTPFGGTKANGFEKGARGAARALSNEDGHCTHLRHNSALPNSANAREEVDMRRLATLRRVASWCMSSHCK